MATGTSSTVVATWYAPDARTWTNRLAPRFVQLERRICVGSLQEGNRSRSVLVCSSSQDGTGKPNKGRRRKTSGEQAQPEKAGASNGDEKKKMSKPRPRRQIGEDKSVGSKERKQAGRPARRRKTEPAPEVRSAEILQVIQVEAEVLSGEDAEEEEEEEEEGEEEEEEENNEVKFPEAESYALVSTYKKREVPRPLSNDEVWWNWRKPNHDDLFWSEFQKRQPQPDITLAAMSALAGQIRLFGDTPTVAETSIYRARKRVFYEERLAAEEKRRKEIGSMAYYQEWVKAWKKDTSLQAVQKHYEETGQDVSVQLQEMLSHQTRAEFRHMMGTDVRIRRDPLVMRATREQKRTVFGGDPVYPTINYIRDPEEVVDYRGPNFHEPRMTVCDYLQKCGTMKTREQHNAFMALEKQRLAEEEEEDGQLVDNLLDEEEMAAAVDIGDKEDEDEDVEGEIEVDQEEEADDDEVVFKDDGIEIVATDQLADDEEPPEGS